MSRRGGAFSRRRSRALISYNPTFLATSSPSDQADNFIPFTGRTSSSRRTTIVVAPPVADLAGQPTTSPSPASPLIPRAARDPAELEPAVRTIERKARKAVLAQAWSTLNPSPSTSERIAR